MKNTIKVITAIITAGIFCTLSAQAVDYYVDGTNGDDSNAGTSAGAGNAWATIGKAMLNRGVVGAGDTIYVATGTYSEKIQGTFTGGTSGNPVNLVADGDVTVTPGDDLAGSQVFYSATDAASARYWNVSGFTFRYHTTVGNGEVVFGKYDSARNWTFEDNTFDNLATVWVGVSDNDSITFINNTFDSVNRITSTTGDNFTFTSNTVLNSSSGNGINVAVGNVNALISHNIFYDSEGTEVVVRGGSAANPTDNIKIINNTFWNDGDTLNAIVTAEGDTLTDFLASNNIFVGYNIAHYNHDLDYTLDASYEFLYSNSTDYSGNWNSGTGDKTGQDPQFLSTTPGDANFMKPSAVSLASSGGNPAYVSYFGAVQPSSGATVFKFK